MPTDAMRPSNNAGEQSSRKRRRKTAGGGATDDCFTCRNRGVKCDRKRPYCTPCIEIGQECTGYKTTLTWGVGIASRGKLRGMSCPVNKNAEATQPGPAETDARRRKTSAAKTIKQESMIDARSDSVSSLGTATGSPTSLSTQDDTQMYTATTESSTMPSPEPEWHVNAGFNEHTNSRDFRDDQSRSVDRRPTGEFYNTIGSPYNGFNVSNSEPSLSRYTDSDFYTPMEYPPFSESLSRPMSDTFVDQIMTGLSTDPFPTDYAAMYSAASGMDSSIASSQHFSTYNEQRPEVLTELNDFMHAQYYSDVTTFRSMTNLHAAIQHSSAQQQEERENEQRELDSLDIRFSNTFHHVSPRLQSLMEYYDRNICPYLVTFDGPDNPYRKHILQFALSNEGLQNAIAALSTNNFRMRKKGPHVSLADITRAFDGSPSEDYNEPTAEETYYKKMSINQLNMQLTDIRAAQDDSVLATLLILCLFHVCDSGFSRFKTQLSGVQKLLSLRNPGTQSDFTRWVEMFFTWFDVMTSSVNDREMQINGESMKMLDSTQNLGAMEQYSGCNGRLFKLISRLGRLNLLAQGRTVRYESGANETSDLQPPVAPQSQSMGQSDCHKPRNNRAASVGDYDNVDGNGWGTSIFSADDQSRVSLPDFASEWYDLRTKLQTWQMDSFYNAANVSPNAPKDPAELELGKTDLIHINEAFRYAALLYVERLGYPLLASHENQFQYLVSQALYHITAVSTTSCVNKFLLWPLFIIGTESVFEDHRSIIRMRCIEIQKESGFYNNLSSLEVLEKVWAEDRAGVQQRAVDDANCRRQDSRQIFRWRRAMDKIDGEYIVI